MSQNKCIIWGTPLRPFDMTTHLETLSNQLPPPYIKMIEDLNYEVCNPRAGGKYTVEHKTLICQLYNNDLKNEEEKVKLSGYIAQENLRGNTPNLSELIKDNNWLEKLPSTPNPGERADLLLEGLVKETNFIGKKFSVEDFRMYNFDYAFFYALSYCHEYEEMNYLINYLKDGKYIQFLRSRYAFTVTVKGFETIKNVSNIDSKTVFVAMWITDSKDTEHKTMEVLYKKIEQAIRQVGYQPLRIDKKEHINKIDDEILSEINKARFIICDLTSEKEKPRGSVYFEAGYALGKNIPIIWTCKKELEKELPFDIRQYNCLHWEENKLDDFEEKLKHRIENVIGKSPLKGGNI